MNDSSNKEINLTVDLKEKIEDSISAILRREFNDERANIVSKSERLNFSCPYCRDSSTDLHKKRGNLYWNSLMYHCYNDGCPNPHTNVVSLLKDFNERFSSLDDMSLALNYIKANSDKKTFNSTTYLQYKVFETIDSLAIPKETLLRKLYAKPVTKHDSIYSYLKSRLAHKHLEYFAYNQKRNQLYIFNLRNGKVIGFQIRNMDSKYRMKYLSYTLEKIYNDILKTPKTFESVENKEKINTLSIYFGIFEVDFSRTFTVFEGPIDHYIYPRNSIAISGANKNSVMFDNNSNVRYFFDNDSAGIKIMNEKIREGHSVFMWKKFLEDHDIPKKKIKDYNDLIIYCFRNSIAAHKNIDNYFSNSKLDSYYI